MNERQHNERYRPVHNTPTIFVHDYIKINNCRSKKLDLEQSYFQPIEIKLKHYLFKVNFYYRNI